MLEFGKRITAHSESDAFNKSSSTKRHRASIEHSRAVRLEAGISATIRIEKIASNRGTHKITSSPAGDNHPHSDRHTRRSKDVADYRRHRREKAPIGQSIDDDKNRQWS